MPRPLAAPLLAALAAVLALGTVRAGAEQSAVQMRAVVVELYTSQGCSSCPPADAMMHHLARRDEVIALALHVDYWDYIGWADIFAQPAFTKRQKAYARAAGKRMVYTPQIIVGGRDFVVGNEPMEVTDAIAAHARLPEQVALRLTRVGDRLRIEAAALGPLPSEMVVQLVRYLPEETVEITRGENAGRRLTYTNIVTDWTEVARWSGAAPLELDVPAPGSAPAAVIVQTAGFGPVIAAAALR
jgi:hypothetical protein